MEPGKVGGCDITATYGGTEINEKLLIRSCVSRIPATNANACVVEALVVPVIGISLRMSFRNNFEVLAALLFRKIASLFSSGVLSHA